MIKKIIVKAHNKTKIEYLTEKDLKENKAYNKFQNKLNVIVGEYFILNNNINIDTQILLGSCIAICIYDTNTGIYGVNHFLTPIGDNFRHGDYSINSMLSEMLKLGCNLENLECKIYGGGKLTKLNLNHTNIGEMNADFAFEYMKNKKINVIHHIVKRNTGLQIIIKPNFKIITKEI